MADWLRSSTDGRLLATVLFEIIYRVTYHIRPHKLFALLPEATSERIVSVKLPRRTENYLLETALLLAAAKIVNARRIFEFGTI